MSEVAPYLRGGGTRQRVVLEGNRLVLSCLVGGSWPLQYRWSLNNSNLTDWTPQYRSALTHSWGVPLHPSFPPPPTHPPPLQHWADWKALQCESAGSRFPLLHSSSRFWSRSREPLMNPPPPMMSVTGGPWSQSLTYLGVLPFYCHHLSCQGPEKRGGEGVS